MSALETFARVIYEAAPSEDLITDRGEIIRRAVPWADASHAYREQAFKQARAVLDFVKKGITS